MDLSGLDEDDLRAFTKASPISANAVNSGPGQFPHWMHYDESDQATISTTETGSTQHPDLPVSYQLSSHFSEETKFTPYLPRRGEHRFDITELGVWPAIPTSSKEYKPILCPHCGDSFTKRSDRRKHWQSCCQYLGDVKASSADASVCPRCEFVARTPRHRERHREGTGHDGAWDSIQLCDKTRFTCCGDKTIYRNALDFSMHLDRDGCAANGCNVDHTRIFTLLQEGRSLDGNHDYLYKALMEHCESHGLSEDDCKSGIRALPIPQARALASRLEWGLRDQKDHVLARLGFTDLATIIAQTLSLATSSSLPVRRIGEGLRPLESQDQGTAPKDITDQPGTNTVSTQFSEYHPRRAAESPLRGAHSSDAALDLSLHALWDDNHHKIDDMRAFANRPSAPLNLHVRLGTISRESYLRGLYDSINQSGLQQRRSEIRLEPATPQLADISRVGFAGAYQSSPPCRSCGQPQGRDCLMSRCVRRSRRHGGILDPAAVAQAFQQFELQAGDGRVPTQIVPSFSSILSLAASWIVQPLLAAEDTEMATSIPDRRLNSFEEPKASIDTTTTSETHAAERDEAPSTWEETKLVEDLAKHVSGLRERVRELLWLTNSGDEDNLPRGRSMSASSRRYTVSSTPHDLSQHTRSGRRRSNSVPIAYRGDRHHLQQIVAAGHVNEGSGEHQSHRSNEQLQQSLLTLSSLGPNGTRSRSDTASDNGKRRSSSGPRRKRRRTSNQQEASGDDFKLCCIFFVGEPNIYSEHIHEYDYISGLLRHLNVDHNFYACQHCFQRFVSGTDQAGHSCTKACGRRSCRRHVARSADRPATCVHFTTAKEQWRHLYRLQYPGIPPSLPILTLETVNGPEYTIDAGNLPEPQALSHAQVSLPAQSITDDTSEDEVAESLPSEPRSTGGASCQIKSLMDEIQLLRQQIQILDQRVTSRPTKREEDLEITLGNVWDALCRSGSREAEPESSLWRLVRRDAASVLSTASAPLVSADSSMMMQPLPQNVVPEAGDCDLDQLFDFSNLSNFSKAPTIDSGYGRSI